MLKENTVLVSSSQYTERNEWLCEFCGKKLLPKYTEFAQNNYVLLLLYHHLKYGSKRSFNPMKLLKELSRLKWTDKEILFLIPNDYLTHIITEYPCPKCSKQTWFLFQIGRISYDASTFKTQKDACEFHNEIDKEFFKDFHKLSPI